MKEDIQLVFNKAEDYAMYNNILQFNPTSELKNITEISPEKPLTVNVDFYNFK